MHIIEIKNGQTIQIQNNVNSDLTVTKAEGEVFLHEGENYFGPFIKVYKDGSLQSKKKLLFVGFDFNGKGYVYRLENDGLRGIQLKECRPDVMKFVIRNANFAPEGSVELQKVDVSKIYKDNLICVSENGIKVYETERLACRFAFCEEQSTRKVFVVNPLDKQKTLSEYEKFETFEELCDYYNKKYDLFIYSIDKFSNNEYLNDFFLSINNPVYKLSTKQIAKIVRIVKERIGQESFVNLDRPLTFARMDQNYVVVKDLFEKFNILKEEISNKAYEFYIDERDFCEKEIEKGREASYRSFDFFIRRQIIRALLNNDNNVKHCKFTETKVKYGDEIIFNSFSSLDDNVKAILKKRRAGEAVSMSHPSEFIGKLIGRDEGHLSDVLRELQIVLRDVLSGKYVNEDIYGDFQFDDENDGE